MKLVKKIRDTVLWQRSFEPEARRLFALLTRSARDEAFYAEAGVEDTFEGRFELLCLHVAFVMQRLQDVNDPRAGRYMQDLFDVMFEDLEYMIREIGIGDLAVRHKMKLLWNSYHGRLKAYIDAESEGALIQAVSRNIYNQDQPLPLEMAALWLEYTKAFRSVLASWSFEDFLAVKREEEVALVRFKN